MNVGFRASPQQRRTWSYMLAHGPQPFNVACLARIPAPLDAERLEDAIQSLIHRHDILRTSFTRLPGIAYPLQRVCADARLNLDFVDWTSLSGAERVDRCSAAFDTMIAGELSQSDPAIDFRAFATGKSCLWIIRISALQCDRIGLRNFLYDLWNLYHGCVRAAETPLQYADIAGVLNDLMEGEEGQAGMEYWQSQDLSPLAMMRFPLEGWGVEPGSFRPRQVPIPDIGQLGVILSRVSGQLGVPASAVMMAAWYLLLARITNAFRPVVGVLTTGRAYDPLPKTIGPLSKVLPIAYELSRRASLEETCEALWATYCTSTKWEDQFDLSRVRVSGQPDHLSYCRVVFDIEENSVDQADAVSHPVILREYSCAEPFAIKLSGRITEQDVACNLLFSPNVISIDYATKIAEQYRNLLSGALANPEREFGKIVLPGPIRRSNRSAAFHSASREGGRAYCLHELVEQRAVDTPSHIAVIGDGIALSYKELDMAATAVAQRLIQLGVGPEQRVGVCLPHGNDLLPVVLGVLKSGGAYVPLHPETPRIRTEEILQEAGARVVVTNTELAARFIELRLQICVIDADGPTRLASTGFILPQVNPDNLAYVMYTSGSTGRPKGVMISHHAVRERLKWGQELTSLTSSDRVLQLTPYSFDFSVWELFAPLALGATVIFPPADANLDMALLCSLIEGIDATIVHFSPSGLAAFLDQIEVGRCRSLRLVFSGGEELSPALAERFHNLLDAELYNQYGPTEATIDVTCWRCRPGENAPFIPIGAPAGTNTILILDDRLNEVMLGEEGDIYIGGPSLSRGYIARPDLTAESFVPDPLSGEPGARLYRTGDRGCWLVNGAIRFMGRRDSQIKLRGMRIETGEIELTAASHPLVRAAVANIWEDASLGKQLVCYVVPRNSESDVPRELIKYLRSYLEERLPAYMVPSFIIILDELPLGPNGKVLYRLLPSPPDYHARFQVEPAPPETETEQRLAVIWSEVLGVEVRDRNADFFLLGGHSLLAMQVVSRIRESCQVELPVRTIFDKRNLRELAGAINNAETHQSLEILLPMVPASREKYRVIRSTNEPDDRQED